MNPYGWSTGLDGRQTGWYSDVNEEAHVNDLEVNDMILQDLKDAAHGLPVKFETAEGVDGPVFNVYICGEQTGAIVRKARADWYNVSLVSMGITEHGEARRALARHINDYIDNRVGGY